MCLNLVRWTLGCLGLLITGALLLPSPVFAAPAPNPRVPAYDAGAVLVAYEDGAPRPARLSAAGRLGLTVDPRVRNRYFVRLQIGKTARAAGMDVKKAIA